MASLESIVKRYKADLLKVARKSVIELGARIKDGTPIGKTGNARGSWKDNGPLVTGKLYIYESKGVDYVKYLEYGNKFTAPKGHSPQAPRGMVRINVKKWDSIVSKHAKAI